jgi:hypothetical protein
VTGPCADSIKRNPFGSFGGSLFQWTDIPIIRLCTSYKKSIRLKYFSFILFYETDEEEEEEGEEEEEEEEGKEDNVDYDDDNNSCIQAFYALTKQHEGQLQKQHELHTIYTSKIRKQQ